MTISIARAYANARRNVGVMYSMGRGQYAFNTWSKKHNAWWQGRTRPYYQAVEDRCQALVAETLEALGYDAFDAAGHAEDCRFTGRVVERVKAIVGCHPL